jgi:hypothetical protein
MLPIMSPWTTTFDDFVASIEESAIIAAPFITQPGVQRLVKGLQSKPSVNLAVLTSLNAHSLTEKLCDSGALSWLCREVPNTTVKHIRYLHAKSYVADGHTAIVTSANLTGGGLSGNYELGVAITDVHAVSKISGYLQQYANLGVPVPHGALLDLDNLAQRAQDQQQKAAQATPDDAESEIKAILDDINEKLIKLRVDTVASAANTNESITSQFCLAVELALSQHRSMRTLDLNPVVQMLLPEYCDDEIDRVINGVSFGRKWKHHTRNAQQQLQRNGVIVLENGSWRLA